MKLSNTAVLLLGCVLLAIIGQMMITHGLKGLRPGGVPQAQPDTLQDSILFYREKRMMHQDSALYYDSLSTIANEKYINYKLAGVATLDSIRADYRNRLRAKIRASAPGHSDSLRTSETNGI